MNIRNLKRIKLWTDNNYVFFPSSCLFSICNILVTVLLCATLKPNGRFFGNFFWLDMGSTNSEKESNTLNESLFTKVKSLLSGYFFSFVLNPVQS